MLIKRAIGGEGVEFNSIKIESDYFVREAMENAKEQGYACSHCGLMGEEGPKTITINGREDWKDEWLMSVLEEERTNRPPITDENDKPLYDGGMGWFTTHIGEGKDRKEVKYRMENLDAVEKKERRPLFTVDHNKMEDTIFPCNGFTLVRAKNSAGKWIEIITPVGKDGKEMDDNFIISSNDNGVTFSSTIKSIGLVPKTERKLTVLKL